MKVKIVQFLTSEQNYCLIHDCVRVNLKIVCRENYKYEVQEKSPANQAVTMQQLAEEYWRSAVSYFWLSL